jgi:glycosyltransferase involved in cell wall biosynthesis
MKKYSFLLIVPAYACTPISGAGQRTTLVYRSLIKIGIVDVVVVGTSEHNDFFKKCFSEAKTVKCLQSVARANIGLWRYFRPIHPVLLDILATTFGARKYSYTPEDSLHDELKRLHQINKYDLIVSRYLRPAAYSGALNLTDVPVIVDLDDRDDVVYSSRLKCGNVNFFARLVLMWHQKQVIEIMSKLLSKTSHIWLTSEEDSLAVEHHSKSVLPNIPYIDNEALSIEQLAEQDKTIDSKTILFVGAFGHRVNREAMDHFIRNCWPKIHAAVKDAKLRVVGSGGWESQKKTYANIQNIEIVGYVEDISTEYSKASFSIVPIFEGGGTKIKVLESLLHNRTAVISTHAQYGYDQLRNGESLIVAANDDEMIGGCIMLINDPMLCAKLANNGKANISKYTFENFAAKIKCSVDTVLS